MYHRQLLGLIEGHGTSTKVGDVTEVGSLNTVFTPLWVETGNSRPGISEIEFWSLEELRLARRVC